MKPTYEQIREKYLHLKDAALEVVQAEDVHLGNAVAHRAETLKAVQ